MKSIPISFVIFLGLVLSGCGAGSSSVRANSASAQLDGIWTAQAWNSDGTSAMVFQTLMTQASNDVVSVKMLSFLIPDPCFPEKTSRNATFTQTGNVDGKPTGPFSMTVIASPPTPVSSTGNNTLTLDGSMSGPVISGTWSVASDSASCVGSGTFTMNQLPSN